MAVLMVKVGPELYTPLDNVLNAICKDVGLPQNLQYYYIDEDGNLAHDIPVYHNGIEKDVVTADPKKVEFAKAIMTIFNYMHLKEESRVTCEEMK